MGWTGEPPPFFPSADTTASERDELSEILPKRLYLTNFRGAESLDGLKRIKCTHIAAVGAEFLENTDNHAASELKVRFWNKDVTDDEEEGNNMGASLRDAALFIHKALKSKRNCVLVHCAAGISRSATVVLGYLILHEKMSLREGFALVHKKRPCIWPNEGFMAALIKLEAEKRGGKMSLSSDEYERWGDYDGPEVECETPGAHARTKAARHQAAVEATEEAMKTHLARRQTTQQALSSRPAASGTGGLRGVLRFIFRRRRLGNPKVLPSTDLYGASPSPSPSPSKRSRRGG